MVDGVKQSFRKRLTFGGHILVTFSKSNYLFKIYLFINNHEKATIKTRNERERERREKKINKVYQF